jgi:hypothetical protein
MYPTNLQFLTKKIKNFTRKTVKLQPSALTTATSQSQIEVILPPNALVDLSTFAFYSVGNITVIPVTATPAVTAYGCFPKNVDGVIFNKISVEANNTVLDVGCQNYSHLYNTLADFTYGRPMEDKRAVLFSNPVEAVPTDDTKQSNIDICCNNFHGLLATIKPHIIDTGILGVVKVRFQMNTDDILVRTNNTQSISYTLSNIYFSVDVLQIDDGVYYNVYLDAINSNKATVSYQYRQWINYSSSTTSGSSTTNFSINTQSLNRILGILVYPSAFPRGQNGPYWDNTSMTSTFFTRFGNGAINVNGTNINPGITGWQFNVQGEFRPSYIMQNPIHTYPLLLNSLGMSQDVLHGTSQYITSKNVFLSNFFCMACQLEHGDESFISGLDSRGNPAMSYLTTYGQAAGATLLTLIFCEVSSSVIVGSGYQLLPII